MNVIVHAPVAELINQRGIPVVIAGKIHITVGQFPLNTWARSWQVRSVENRLDRKKETVRTIEEIC